MELEPFGAQHEAPLCDDAVADEQAFEDGVSPAALRAEATDVDTVTRVGRLADERDAQYFKNLASRNLKAASAK